MDDNNGTYTFTVDNPSKRQVFYAGKGIVQPNHIKLGSFVAISNHHFRIIYDPEYGWILEDGITIDEGGMDKPSLNGTCVHLNSWSDLRTRKPSFGYKLQSNQIFDICGYWF